MSLAIRVRRRAGGLEKPTFLTLCSSFLLFRCHHALNRDNTAWFYLREALTLVYVLQLHVEESYDLIEGRGQIALRRNMFWILFVTER
jgi:hypothetical protein